MVSRDGTKSIRLLFVATLLGLTPGGARAYNSEEHKLATDLGVSEVVIDPTVSLPFPTSLLEVTPASDRASYQAAKQLAVGFGSNDVGQYSDHTKGVQDNSYWVYNGLGVQTYAQRGMLDAPYDGNLWIWIPFDSYLSTTLLPVSSHAHGEEGTFTLGQLVSLYGDYRKTTYCDAGRCYLTNEDTPTIGFAKGENCFWINPPGWPPWPEEDCGYRPTPVQSETYLKAIGSGLWPPYGPLGNASGNTADTEHDYFEAGWWGDEMLRIAAINDWHFSTAALAWYVGMHRLALRYVDRAREDPSAWNAALHYEANALHSLTDLFAFGHVVTHRDATSYGIVEEEGAGLVTSSTYQWMQNVLAMGGAERTAESCSGLGTYTCRKVEYAAGFSSLPPVAEPAHGRNDFLATYAPGAWALWAVAEKNLHAAFNEAGACVRNLNGDAFFVYGDARLRFMLDGDSAGQSTRCGVRTESGIRVVAGAVRASVQALFDAYPALSAGTATVDELASVGSPYFAALRHVPVYVIRDAHAEAHDALIPQGPGNGFLPGGGRFTGRWTRYARAADVISGSGVVPASWADCRMEYVNGGTPPPGPDRARCQKFPLVVTPASAEVQPGGGSTFTAKGGSDVDTYPAAPGYAWTLATNASGGSIDPATGAYAAGQTGGVTDVVLVTDDNGDTARAFVHVAGGTPSTRSSGGCSAGGAGALSLLLVAFGLVRRARRPRGAA
jgi:hypothetical protein